MASPPRRGIDDAAAGNQEADVHRQYPFQHGHPHRDSVLHLIQNHRALAVRDFRTEFAPAIDRARMHHDDVGFRQRQMLQPQAIETEIFARRHRRFVLPFQLHAQHHDHVGIADRFRHFVSQPHAGRELLQFARNERRRSAKHDVRAEFREQMNIGAGHAAVRDIADDRDAQAFERGARSRIVRASSSACVGCSCVPSPALTIGICRCRARKCGAPEAAWRITMAFGRIATSVFSVSTSDSPFETLDPCAAIETVSAPSRFAAISKLTRVRVEASKNRLTIILPRSASRRR